MMVYEVNLNKTIVISFLLHALVLFFLPNMRHSIMAENEFIEIEIVKLPKVKVLKRSKRIVNKPTKKVIKRSQIPRKALEAIPTTRGRLEVSAPPEVALPMRAMTQEAPPIDAVQLDKRVFEEPAGIQKAISSEKMAYFASEREPLPFENLRFGEKKAPIPLDLDEGGIKEFPLPEIASQAPVLPTLGVQDYGGTVGRRKVLVAGGASGVNSVSRDVTIRVRFDVLPDGTVVNLRPVSKGGDARLERTAMKIAKKYKFVPLPPDADQIVQWGVLPVTFKQ